MDKIVVIGAGQASGWAVNTFRQQGFTGEIHVVSNEEHVFYERPPLSKQVLAQDASYESLQLFQPEQIDQFSVIWHKPDLAIAIDREQKLVMLKSGQQLSYDKLLIATGSRARVPLTGWREIQNLFTLRNIQDCERLTHVFEQSEKLAIIGGGWIGLEIAATARQQGKQVDVFEYGERLCARSVSPEVSEFLKQIHEEAGTQIHLNAKHLDVRELENQQILIEDPVQSATFDAVVVGAGADIAKELAVDAGLAVKDGIVVDHYGQTSDSSIYAAGDVAIHPSLGYSIQSWANAQNQAISAAKSMLGVATEYVDIPWLWSDQYDYNIQILGTYQADSTQQVVIRELSHKQKSFIYLDQYNRILNVIAVNDSKLIKLAKRWINSGYVVDPQQLTDPNFNLMKLKA